MHEAWLRLLGKGERTWQNRAHFFGAAAQAMRRVMIDHARRKALDLAETSADEKVLLIHEALGQLEAEDPVKANIVALKFFAGLSNHEVAACLGTTERTIERHWAFARTWLYQCIKATDTAKAP